VLPVSLSGGSRLFAHAGLPFKADVALGVVIHPPVQPPSELEGDAFESWLEQTRETVAQGVLRLQTRV
jgi:hypothetical protein